MQRERKTFDVSSYKLEIDTFELEEISGEEELAAIERAGTNPTGSRLQEQMVADSIVSVNGEPVVRPYVDWKKWKSRTRDFVRAAFHKMNSGAPAEIDDFMKAAFGD